MFEKDIKKTKQQSFIFQGSKREEERGRES